MARTSCKRVLEKYLAGSLGHVPEWRSTGEDLEKDLQRAVQASMGLLQEVADELEAAMKLPGVRAPLTARQEEEARRKKTILVSVQDRATVFIMLAEVLHKLERAADALNPMLSHLPFLKKQHPAPRPTPF